MGQRSALLAARIILSLMVISGQLAVAKKEPASFWDKNAKEDIDRAWQRVPNHRVAKNLVLAVGDGMGLATVTAARIYTGQKLGRDGELYQFSFETFPYVALSKTYNLDRQVSDSAGTAVAMVTGVKVNMGSLGVNGDVPAVPNCTEVRDDRKLKTVLDYALEEGKSVGIVTTTRVTHATPAATYAHVPWRDWENDADMAGVTGCEHVRDISYQLILDNPNIQVILGGGRRSFLNTTRGGKRIDGLDLVEIWKHNQSTLGRSHSYVEDKAELDRVNPDTTDTLLGLFTTSHMNYELDRNSSVEPSLTEMVTKAVRILARNPKGFFLLLEGGRIDQAHHDNYAKKALEETAEFDNAVKKVTELTPADDTLIVVTADHSHVFTMAGYPTRGNNILGIVDDVPVSDMPYDKMPFLTLGYQNGPHSFRTNYSQVDTTRNEFQQPGCIGMPSETHGGEDVAIYARGPMAHFFHTTHEQSYIGHVLMYSACLGPYKANCDLDKRRKSDSAFCGVARFSSSWLATLLLALVACSSWTFHDILAHTV